MAQKNPRASSQKEESPCRCCIESSDCCDRTSLSQPDYIVFYGSLTAIVFVLIIVGLGKSLSLSLAISKIYVIFPSEILV